MRLELPFPPSANTLYRTLVAGKRAFPVKSKEHRDYVAKVAAAMKATRAQPFPAGVAVAVTAHLYRPRKTGDLDNSFKALMDVMTGMAYADDSQVVEIHAYRHDDKANPRAVVDVDPADIFRTSADIDRAMGFDFD